MGNKAPKFLVEHDPYNSRLTGSNDVQLRYANSVIFFDNVPVYVGEDRTRDGEFLVSLYDYVPGAVYRPGGVQRRISKDEVGWFDIRDKKVNTDGSKLGWMTFNGHPHKNYIVPTCYYLSRSPVRKYKQGFCASNTYGFGVSKMSKNEAPVLSSLNINKDYILQNLSGTSHMHIDEFVGILFNKDTVERVEELGTHSHQLGFSINNEVALSYKPKQLSGVDKRSEQLRDMSRNYKDLEFYIWVEDQLIGTYIPINKEVNSIGNGLFSVYQQSLIRAKLL